MNGEIITVGSEILIGDIVNTHSQYISQKMADYGINVLWHTSVGDNQSRLLEITNLAFKRSDIVIFTGGLGPTKDDLTKETVCAELGLELIENKEIAQSIERYFNKIGREMPKSNYKQAVVPKGATIFENRNGTASGLAVEKKGKTAILLPGPPNELMPMYEESVDKYIKDLTKETIVSSNIHFFGIGESTVDEKLSDLLDGKNPTVALYAKESEVRARVTAKSSSQQDCEKMIKPVVDDIKNRLNKYIYGIDIVSMENALVKQAIAKNKMIATAESCTGGMIAQMITSVSGSSRIFEGAVVSYSNHIKKSVLNVSDDSLNKYGAVSHQVAKEMAVGVRKLTGSDIGLSTTGIAGPSGGSDEKPVGLVYIGVSTKDKTYCVELKLSKDIENERETIRRRASIFALNEMRKML